MGRIYLCHSYVSSVLSLQSRTMIGVAKFLVIAQKKRDLLDLLICRIGILSKTTMESVLGVAIV